MADGESERPQRTGLGAGIILVSVLTMAFADAVVKFVSADLTVWQVFVTRSLVAIPLLMVLMAAAADRLTPRDPKWAFIRGGLLVLCWLAFYASFPVLDLSVAAVAVYTNPIMIALLSALLIGEPVTPRQRGGVLLGFLGVLAILKPGTDAFSWFVFLPMIGAAFYAAAMLMTRSKCQDEPPLALGLALHVSFLIAGLIGSGLLFLIGLGEETRASYPFLLGGWRAMGVREWGLMALIGALSAAYFVGVARAYQIAAPSVIATFDYAYLVSAALWGFVFFAERPDALTVAGMALITAAGLLVAARTSKPTGNSR